MPDRLDLCKDRLRYKLENAIEHVATLAKRIKDASPTKVQLLCTEMVELQQEIADLRNAIHYISDFEVEYAEENPHSNRR